MAQVALSRVLLILNLDSKLQLLKECVPQMFPRTQGSLNPKP